MSKEILIVDDDRLVLKSLKKLLQMYGYSAETAESGKDALLKVKEKYFSLVICDVRMTDIDGLETARRIKEHYLKEQKSPPEIIFISGYTDKESKLQAQKIPARDFIYKPFSKEKFIESVTSAIS